MEERGERISSLGTSKQMPESRGQWLNVTTFRGESALTLLVNATNNKRHKKWRNPSNLITCHGNNDGWQQGRWRRNGDGDGDSVPHLLSNKKSYNYEYILCNWFSGETKGWMDPWFGDGSELRLSKCWICQSNNFAVVRFKLKCMPLTTKRESWLK